MAFSRLTMILLLCHSAGPKMGSTLAILLAQAGLFAASVPRSREVVLSFAAKKRALLFSLDTEIYIA